MSTSEEIPPGPSLDDRARMFMVLSREYLELVPAMPKIRVSLALSGDAKTVEARTTRRVLVLSLALGRKFITKGEPVYVPGLLHSVIQERGKAVPREIKKDVSGMVHLMREAIDDLHTQGGWVGSVDTDSTSPSELWDLIRYGSILHSDYEKWVRHGPAAWAAAEMNASFMLSGLRSWLLQARWFMGDLAERGVLHGLEIREPEEIAQDRWAPDGSNLGIQPPG